MLLVDPAINFIRAAFTGEMTASYSRRDEKLPRRRRGGANEEEWSISLKRVQTKFYLLFHPSSVLSVELMGKLRFKQHIILHDSTTSVPLHRSTPKQTEASQLSTCSDQSWSLSRYTKHEVVWGEIVTRRVTKRYWPSIYIPPLRSEHTRISASFISFLLLAVRFFSPRNHRQPKLIMRNLQNIGPTRIYPFLKNHKILQHCGNKVYLTLVHRELVACVLCAFRAQFEVIENEKAAKGSPL